MTFKIKKTAKAASAVALSALMASTVFAGLTASAATARPLGDVLPNGTGSNLVYTVGGWFDTKDCYLVGGEYYPKGTVNFTDIYKEYTDGTVLIEGSLYRMKDCVYYNGRYYSRDASPITSNVSYNEYGNYVYINGLYYLKADCIYSGGRYTPKSGATGSTYIPYYYNYNGYYSEYGDYVIIGGYYYKKSDCTYDSATKRYYPKSGITGQYYYDYYYNANDYVEGTDYVIIDGYVYSKSNCVYRDGRYYPKNISNYVSYYPSGSYYYNGKYYSSYAAYLSALGYNPNSYWNGYYYTPSSSSVSESDPFIYGNEKRKGWTTILNAVYSSKKGSTVKVDMNETDVISKKFLNAVEGNNINLQLVMSNGAVWSFNGKDVDKDSIRAVNVSVKYNTNKVPAILRQKASMNQGSFCEITVGTDSAYLGFDGSLTTKFNKRNAGKTATIYRYDSGRNVLVSVDTATINSDGTAAFDLVNTGTYFITISK